ncbi:PspC domain-containing protein [uncultured Alistipes sp.]|uniref:PspC domain-containing protein n=1 Tax=uncultured Alistipes sp. TaxID=538949 RepID=UPI0025EC06FF|nr:PspC domain-containing protein [uncultured Alistipes sp.]
MKEVKKCSISGVAFTLDADAYQELATYLESLKKTYKENPDGGEIIADIEARIAELILSAQDTSRIVEKPLILNIIRQMGTAEDISEENAGKKHSEEPRIPRRLYRDTENAKLGGVCAGIGKYFDVDPVWVRLCLFLPLLLTALHWIPFMHWIGPMMSNLFGIFIICYIIMWFAVPAARTARQKLEMNGERITAQSIQETTAATTEAAASNDADAKAKPIVAEAVSVFGQIVLILLKIFAGLIVFGLIMAACGLIIGLFAIIVGGNSVLSPDFLTGYTVWLPILGILIALIPIILLIYVLMCLIASRKPGGKTVLVVFILWLITFIACACVAINEDFGDRIRTKRSVVNRMLNTKVVIDNDTMTIEKLLDKYDSHNIIENNQKTLHISIPNRSIDIKIDKKKGGLEISSDGKQISVKTGSDTSQDTSEPSEEESSGE